jgi:hypothetical protein
MLTKEYLNDLIEYCDGVLYWKKARQGVTVGKPVGCLNAKGYLRTKINGEHYRNHRLIFLMHYGYLPAIVDHIDNNPLNNRIENLRPATNAENGYNAKTPKHNTSGLKNIFWSKRDKKWLVQLRIDGGKKSFGSYFDLDYAKFVADAMRYKYHKAFARHE